MIFNSVSEVGIESGDEIDVTSTGPSSFLQQMLEDRLGPATIDLTFGSGQGHIIITLQAVDLVSMHVQSIVQDNVTLKVDRNVTTLQLVFSSFADRENIDASSIYYVHGQRRFSHEAEETAAQANINNGDIIYALTKTRPSFPQTPTKGKIMFSIMRIGWDDSDKELFNYDVNKPIANVLRAYATSRKGGLELDNLRFMYRGRTLFADSRIVFDDSRDNVTPAQLAISNNDTIHVITKEAAPNSPITPNCIKKLNTVKSGLISDPVVQIIH